MVDLGNTNAECSIIFRGSKMQESSKLSGGEPLYQVLGRLCEDDRFFRIFLLLQASFAIFSTDGDLLFLSPSARSLLGLPEKGPVPEYNLTRDDNFVGTEYSSFIKSALACEEVFLPIVQYKFSGSSLGQALNDVLPLRMSFHPIEDIDGRSLIILRIWKEREDVRFQPILLMQRSESASMLARGIAHEFNNVLASIRSAVSIIQLDLDPSHPSHSYLKKLDELVNRGCKLISDLTSYVRVSEPVFEVMALQDYAEHFFGLAALMVPRGINLVTSVSGTNHIRIDIHRLDQALFNLVHNAIEAVSEAEVKTVSIKMEETSLTGWESDLFEERISRAVRITVEDSGPGIPEEVYPKIFEPYFSTKEPRRNSGLGLNVAEQIVIEHSGILLAFPHGSLGGASFSIYLPLSKEPEVSGA